MGRVGGRTAGPIEVQLKGVAAAGSFVFAVIVLAGGYDRRANRLLAAFLFLIAGNQALEAYRAAFPSMDMTMFRWATVFAIADPLLLYGFASVHPQPNALARRKWWILMGIPAVGLLAWAMWVPTTQFDDGRFAVGEAALAIYTAAIYASIWAHILRRVASGTAEPGFRLLYPAFAVATFPVWGRVAFGLAQLLPVVAGGSVAGAVQLIRPLGFTAAMLLAAWLTVRWTRLPAPEAAYVRRWTWVAIGLSFFLAYATVYEFLGYFGLRAFNPAWPWFILAAGAAVRWLVFGAFVSMAVLRYEMLTMSLHFRRTAARILVAYAFVAAASLMVAVFQESTGQRSFGLRPIEAGVIFGALLLSQGFRRVVAHMATRWYGLPDRNDRAATVDAYRSALVQAHQRGFSEDDPALRRLRHELRIDERTAQVLVQMAAVPAEGPLAAGQVVGGRYEVLRFLGRGGAGRAFLAKDELLQREVVLKEVLFDGPEEEVAVLKEARLAAGLHHPNVVAVFDVVRRPGSGLIVSEFVAGGTLSERLQRGNLTRDFALAVADGILRGLAAIHSRGIVHRDLTPGNVLLALDGTAKIADFGIARVRRGVTVRFDERDASHGTPEFMAPEQRRGEIATPASDVYQMGLLLRSLFAGIPVDNVDGIIERALLPDPADRFPDAHALREAMRAATGPVAVQVR